MVGVELIESFYVEIFLEGSHENDVVLEDIKGDHNDLKGFEETF